MKLVSLGDCKCLKQITVHGDVGLLLIQLLISSCCAYSFQSRASHLVMVKMMGAKSLKTLLLVA